MDIHADPAENPLFTAVLHNRVNCVRLLIEAGASVNKHNFAQSTPVMEAAKHGYNICLEMLLQAGANVNVLDSNGNPAIFYAAKGVHVLCVKHLIKAGADVNICDINGKTPLMKATECERATTLTKVHMITTLLRAGAYVNKTDIRGNNTLEAYLFRCHPPDETVCLLLYAAGEETTSSFHVQIPEFLQDRAQIHLKHICREAIRKHLLKLDPHQHLFGRIPQLVSHLHSTGTSCSTCRLRHLLQMMKNGSEK